MKPRLIVNYKVKRMLSAAMILVATHLQAQDFKESLLKVKKIFSESERMMLAMTIKAVDRNSSNKVLFTQKAVVYRDSAKYHSQFNGMEIMLNEHYLVVVNHPIKQIHYTPNTSKDQAPATNQLLNLNMDSLLNAYGKVLYVGRANGLDHYEINHGRGNITKTDIYFSDSGMLKKIIYEYLNDLQVDITVDTFSDHPSWSNDMFQESKYWVDQGGELKTTPPFANYKLLVSQPEESKSKKIK